VTATVTADRGKCKRLMVNSSTVYVFQDTLGWLIACFNDDSVCTTLTLGF